MLGTNGDTVPVLLAEGVTKRYGELVAVDEVSLVVREGEIFALLGPNGAGKTSLVRMIVGINRPDRGRLTVHGGTGRPLAASELGYLPEERGLYRDISVFRTLVFFARLRGLDVGAAEAAARAWLDRLGLSDRANDRLETLSKGNQQRIQLASAVLHRPRFAVLDEPFSGLDPVSQELFIDLIRELRNQGTTILLCAHQMNLVERLADRLAVMNRGRVVLSGTLEEIRRQASVTDVLRLRLAEGETVQSLANLNTPGYIDGDELVVAMKPGEDVGRVVSEISRHVRIEAIRSERRTLHDIFVEAVSGPAEEGSAA